MKILLHISLWIILSIPLLKGQTVHYVDIAATGANDGSSWTDAYTDLQAAIDAAVVDDEVWVAAGTYLPISKNTFGGPSSGPDDRGLSFVVSKNIKIYGGFAGGETALGDRDWQNNATILSGDIGIPDDNTDNTFHVVTNRSRDGVVWDGFTVTRGNANSTSGEERFAGGIFNRSSSTIINCTIENNNGDLGGGMVNRFVSSDIVTAINCTFRNNTSIRSGGAVYAQIGQHIFRDCSFESNNASSRGGAILKEGGSSSDLEIDIILENCSFKFNTAELDLKFGRKVVEIKKAKSLQGYDL